MSAFRRKAAGILVLVGCAGAAAGSAQHLAVRLDPPRASSPVAVLRQMTRAAEVIFTGKVIGVRRPAGFAGSGQDAAEGVVEIEFRVDEAVRGCSAGSTYTVREWAGLWTGEDRYRVGERLLVFFHRANAAGISSPVGGKSGLIPLRGGGRAPGPYDADAGVSEWLADLRWVEARALRLSFPVMEPAPVRPGVATLSDEVRGWDSTGSAPGYLPADPFQPSRAPYARRIAALAASEPAMQPLSQVLSLCRGWLAGSNGAR